MNAVTANTKTTLLLNNAWQPITVVTARAAFSHLHKRRISALDKDSNVFHSLDTWNSLAAYYDDQPFLRSAHAGWPIPTVIVVNSKFFRKPKKKKLTLFDLAKLCEYTCQYCFEKFPLKQLSIDHIYPKSLGGKNEHENFALCCIKCNREKSNITPWYDKNGQVPKPTPIPALMLNAPVIRPEWNNFLKNVF
jgi:hypothetical protein